MSTRDKILDILVAGRDGYVSGAEIGERLHISRAAVSGAVAMLRDDGYVIDSRTNKGYRLMPESDVLTADGVARHLSTTGLTIEVYDALPSTNALLKKRAEDGAPEGLVIIAREQSAGRGRMGRSFYSPRGTGLYMSVLLRPRLEPERAPLITTCAAVAAAEVAERLSGRRAEIKWVNDIYMDGKKICGILTESAMSVENRSLAYAVLGIGVNLLPPASDFPDELRTKAAALFTAKTVPDMRSVLAAAILDGFMTRYPRIGEREFYAAYRERSMLIGRRVDIIRPGRANEGAEVLDVAEDFSLIVRLADGTLTNLSSGEVSVRAAE